MTASIEKVSATTESLTKKAVAILERDYTLIKSYQVLAYIEKYPFLLPVLLEASSEVKARFPAASLSLEVFQDVDYSEWVELMLIITTDYEVEELLKRSEQLDNEWFFDLPNEVQEKMFTHIQPIAKKANGL